MPFRTAYGVSKGEVSRFVEENEVVKDWLGKYSGLSVERNAYKLCRFFKWLKVVEGVSLSPKELLNEQIQLMSSENIGDRRKHRRLALRHTRDNPDFKDYDENWKYLIFLTIKNFYDYHDVPLTHGNSLFGRVSRRKPSRKQITLGDVKIILGQLPQRESTILLIALQSGIDIGGLLSKFNFMWDKIIPQIEDNFPRVKVEFEERKGNNFPYFTYFSRDAIQELKKWLLIREGIVAEKGEPKSRPIFVTREGTPYLENNFYTTIDYYRRRKNLPNFVAHQFRKLFKTEASIPERGIDPRIVEFWMGHKILLILGKPSPLGAMGGVYDRTPEIYEDVIEREYEKLEPYINIYSSSVVSRRTDPLLQDIEQLSRVPSVREAFESIVEEAKVLMAERLKRQKIG